MRPEVAFFIREHGDHDPGCQHPTQAATSAERVIGYVVEGLERCEIWRALLA